MNLVVHKNVPFANVDDETVRAAIKFDGISSKILKAHMIACVKLINPLIIAEIKDENFVLVFDGVTDRGDHSLGVFVVTRKGWHFLAFSYFIDESSTTANEHIRFLDIMTSTIWTPRTLGVVCDNMETNKAISRRVDAPMIGCAAHRLNLAVKDYVKNHTATIVKVSVLMQKLKSVKGITMLKQNHCKLNHVGKHIPEEAPANDPRQFPIVQFLPDPGEHCSILDILDDMKLLEMATKRLQDCGLTILSARDIFGGVLVDFPELEHRLTADTKIIESSAFEKSVVKITKGEEKELTTKREHLRGNAIQVRPL
ncbi:hypothetical protein JG688_00006629 [Phytophthora aleatoria]|uniref:DUF659 domain-containing protein n=1 Tax=Phytophthora aleatoria TaxID=2496075 RepID=A0A8J5M8R1_9STRA|nr:hypothetical protein JG688_00006629 [Phytophthora aleatoria]